VRPVLALARDRAYTVFMRMASPLLARAATEYRWLLDRDYASSAALKLVGDRHQMTRDERMILFRGVASSASSAARAALLVGGPEPSLEGRRILVDGHNQALTVMHYLTGRPLFVGSDGLLRDVGGSHGRIADRRLFERAVGALVDGLARSRPSRVEVYLDAPIPGSAGHAALFRGLLAARGIEAGLLLERSADAPLKAAPSLSLVATSDSGIADALAARASSPESPRIYDAARWAIELAFGEPELLDLGRLLAEARDHGNEAR
jgi:hypothetical protein